MNHFDSETIDWVAELPITALGRAATVRLDDSIEAAVADQSGDTAATLWLRGKKLEPPILSLPFAKLYRLESPANEASAQTPRLYPLDARLPTRRLPDELNWTPLAKRIIPAAPAAAPSASLSGEKAKLRLIRGGPIRQPNLLRTDFQTWCDYAIQAPAVRLRPLHFAASHQGEVIVRGTPLPPIHGQGWIEQSGIACPGGYRFEPPLPPEVLPTHLQLLDGEIALISPDASVERIPAENFIPASRAAVRQLLDMRSSPSSSPEP